MCRVVLLRILLRPAVCRARADNGRTECRIRNVLPIRVVPVSYVPVDMVGQLEGQPDLRRLVLHWIAADKVLRTGDPQIALAAVIIDPVGRKDSHPVPRTCGQVKEEEVVPDVILADPRCEDR